MGRRRIDVADITAVLTAYQAGETISTIARRFGYSRPTVRKYLQAAQREGLAVGDDRRSEAAWERLTCATVTRVTPQRTPGPVQEEVARHHAYLEERVGTMQLTVLFDRLRREQGLQASWGSFYRYVAATWPGRLARRPRPTIRLADPPAGEEAQVDFFYAGIWEDLEEQRRRRLYAFLMTLGHSRHQFLYPVVAEDGTAWLDGHVAAFAFFGGAPRRVVPDNLTAGILRADRFDPRLNRAYGELPRYYGVLVDPARVAHPKDKPKVERGVQYARESFFRDQQYPTLAAWRTAAETWCTQVAGVRRHGTTGEAPLAAFQAREAAALQPLPARPWERVQWLEGVVQADCHVRAAGAWYSVPARYIRRAVELRVSARLVEIYEGANLVATHPRQSGGRSTQVGHYPEQGRHFLTYNPAACVQEAATVGPAYQAMVDSVLAPGTLSRLREAQALLRLRDRYPAERLERAAARAVAVDDGRFRTVRTMLAQDLDR